MEGMGWATVLAFGLYTKECGLPDSGRHIVMWAVYSFFYKEELYWVNLGRKTCLEVRVQAEQPCSGTELGEMRGGGRGVSGCPGVRRTLSTR